MFKSSARIALTGFVVGLLGSMAAAGVIVYLASVGLIAQPGPVDDGTPPELVKLLAEHRMSVLVIGGERPAVLALPEDHDGETPIRLLVLLHGYGDDALSLARFYGFARRAVAGEFAIVFADGVPDDEGNQFWNATDLCCGRTTGVKPDDVAYLRWLVVEAGTLVAVDRTYLLGHSNGGFMAYRLACEGVPGLAGIVSIAGSSFEDPARCDGADAVSVLQVHGGRDRIVRIDGGVLPALGPGRYPAAAEVVERWALRAGCDTPSENLSPIRVGDGVKNSWAHVSRYLSGCADGVTVEFWQVPGAGHILSGGDFMDLVLEWLFDQGRELGEDEPDLRQRSS